MWQNGLVGSGLVQEPKTGNFTIYMFGQQTNTNQIDHSLKDELQLESLL